MLARKARLTRCVRAGLIFFVRGLDLAAEAGFGLGAEVGFGLEEVVLVEGFGWSGAAAASCASATPFNRRAEITNEQTELFNFATQKV